MSNFRPYISHDLDSSLADGFGERSVDRLRAFSMASRAGTSLWRGKYACDGSSLRNAVLETLTTRERRDGIMRKLAALAILEFSKFFKFWNEKCLPF